MRTKSNEKKKVITASDNGHFIGFPEPIYDWLKDRKNIHGLKSIPAVVSEIVREKYVQEKRAA